MKQDAVGVRTAQDLERKYNFSSMQKAIKQSEQGITKISSERFSPYSPSTISSP